MSSFGILGLGIILAAPATAQTLTAGKWTGKLTHGSLANWHPHLHLLVTDGGFRADGTFVPLPLHDVTTLTEAFRRAVLRLFVRRELMDMTRCARFQIANCQSAIATHCLQGATS